MKILQVIPYFAPAWAYVNDADFPASGPPPPSRWLTGVVDAHGNAPLDAHPSGGDDPTTHDAFDFNINVLPDPASADLLGGAPDQKNGNFEGTGEETRDYLFIDDLCGLRRQDTGSYGGEAVGDEGSPECGEEGPTSSIHASPAIP